MTGKVAIWTVLLLSSLAVMVCALRFLPYSAV
jgi:hypothetical protein